MTKSYLPLFFVIFFVIGIGAFLSSLFLLVLPNRVQTVSCQINSVNITSGYMSRKRSCSCILSDSRYTSCSYMLELNITGTCFNDDCCFQKSGESCEQYGVDICTVEYCMKTFATLSSTYFSHIHRLLYADCEGDYSRCDVHYTNACIYQLQNNYKTGDRTCYYRSSDDRLELSSFSYNSQFFGGIIMTFFGGIMILMTLYFCVKGGVKVFVNERPIINEKIQSDNVTNTIEV